MLNLAVGVPVAIDGKDCIATKRGLSGHAVYGPYEFFERGRYSVAFGIRIAKHEQLHRDVLCATVEVVSAGGTTTLATANVYSSKLDTGCESIEVIFDLATGMSLEFRVHTNGILPLIVDDYRRVTRIPDRMDDVSSYIDDRKFPDPAILPKPVFFLENIEMFRRLYESRAHIRIAEDAVIVDIDGVSFYAGHHDDLMFVDEIFSNYQYNFLVPGDACVIDVGMNIGLATLHFASKPFVKEVHSFEPFKTTYERALSNFSLNPTFSSKIKPNNFGLAGSDGETTVLIPDELNSGSFSIWGCGNGLKMLIGLKNAAPVFAKIIEDAKAKHLDVVAKIDCEGSEFAIFEALETAGLLSEVSVFMVEWHRGFNKSHNDLIRPLLGAGFTVISQPGTTGNGFFYAIRSSTPTTSLVRHGHGLAQSWRSWVGFAR